MPALTSADLLHDPIGNYPSATVACFDPSCGELPRRKLDEPKTIRFLERLAGYGAPAVLIAASTGHGHVRTVAELKEWFRVAARAHMRGTMKMALLRPEDGNEANAELVMELKQLRYPVVFVRPGRDLPRAATDQQVAANMRPIVEQSAKLGLAVGVYSIPDVSGVPLSAAAAALLVAGPGGDHIVAAKVTEANYETSTLRFLQHPALKSLKIVQGWDTHLARALQDGPAFDSQGRQRCGVTSGPMSFALFQYLHIFAAAERADWAEVQAAQQAVTSLFQAMQDDPTKFADLQRAKFIMGLGEPLTGAVADAQIERVLQALEGLPREGDRSRLARSLDLLGESPCRERLARQSAGDSKTTMATLREMVRQFVDARDWRQYHAPKNLSMSLAVEAAELMEHFQWLSVEESRKVGDDPKRLQEIGEELADVLCYTLALANELNIDLTAAMLDKMVKNVAKYPAEEFRGRFG